MTESRVAGRFLPVLPVFLTTGWGLVFLERLEKKSVSPERRIALPVFVYGPLPASFRWLFHLML
jgi:hypothetical protein